MYPKWSPDGTSISYLTSYNGLSRIIIADSYGNNEKYLIPDTLSFQYDWDWNPVK
jgi:Tol biopolymer transport system component